MKKKTVIIAAIVLFIFILILFLPIPRGTYRDGGTKDYRALTYRIVVWNRLTDRTGEDGAAEVIFTYHKTSVYWFPENLKSIDELWKAETEAINEFRLARIRKMRASSSPAKHNKPARACSLPARAVIYLIGNCSFPIK